METVEIGVIATDDGMTWANTETRDTLGKTRDGWWLELQKYGAERLVLKRYRHIAAVCNHCTAPRSPTAAMRARLTLSSPTTTAAMNWPGHHRLPGVLDRPMVDPNEVHAAWPRPTCCRSRTTPRRRATTTTTTTSSDSSSSRRGSSTALR